MKSIRWKLVFMYLSLVFMVLILTGTYIVISTENREKNKAKEELRQCAVYINEQVVEQYDSRYFQNSLVNLSIVSSSLKNVTGHFG
jgi:two-component system sensor histidine kinase VicK